MEDKSKKKELNKEDNKEIDRYEKIVERAHKEIQRVRLAYMSLITGLSILIAFGGYLTYKSMGDVRNDTSSAIRNFRNELNELRKEVEVRVDKELGKKPIQNLIREGVSEQVDKVTDKIISERIDEKVTPLIKDVEIKVGDLQSQLVATEEKVNQIMADSEKKLRALEGETEKNLKAMQIESKFLLTLLRAQNGEKESWLKLVQIAEEEQETERVRFARDAVEGIYDNFFKTEFVRRKYVAGVSDSSVVESLKHRSARRRKMAVYTVMVRSMHDQIPSLISMIALEENLDVLGEIFRVLNEWLGTNVRYVDTNALRSFEEAWEVKKKELEETRGEKGEGRKKK